jgi:hypothetical protein
MEGGGSERESGIGGKKGLRREGGVRGRVGLEGRKG